MLPSSRPSFAPVVLGLFLLAAHPWLLVGQAAPLWHPELLGAQFSLIGQGLFPFSSPYAGPMSLTARGDAEVSHTYGLYAGIRLARPLDAYLDVEMARGAGVGHATGLAGITNGDVIRQGSADLGEAPYLARAFLRYTIGLTGATIGRVDSLARGMDQLAALAPSSRIEIQAGKFAASDLFDQNRYANSTRTQFENWALFQNTAWDFAADTRGYTNGIAVAWITPRWTLRVGSFQMPRLANGNAFDGDIARARGDNIELALNALPQGGVVRILGYVNHARMGSYAEALAIGEAGHVPPDIAADDAPGRVKYGVGMNIEQPLADGGETGAFARFGWDDGATESFAFSEVDSHLSGGLQLSGVHWGRPADHLALAFVSQGISALHQDYLAAGGRGFLLGDGALTYGRETILEAYYRLQLGRYTEIGPDLQQIWNPGYNRDRGPASILSLRINLRA
ncbi:MAG: carbohydrate porin [Gemmatimonadales bacterium]